MSSNSNVSSPLCSHGWLLAGPLAQKHPGGKYRPLHFLNPNQLFQPVPVELGPVSCFQVIVSARCRHVTFPSHARLEQITGQWNGGIDTLVPLVVLTAATVCVGWSRHQRRRKMSAQYLPLTSEPLPDTADPPSSELDDEVYQWLAKSPDADAPGIVDSIRDVSPRFHWIKKTKAFLMFKLTFLYGSLASELWSAPGPADPWSLVRPVTHALIWGLMLVTYLPVNIMFIDRKNRAEKYYWVYLSISLITGLVALVDTYAEFAFDHTFSWSWDYFFAHRERSLFVASLVFLTDLCAMGILTRRGPRSVTVQETDQTSVRQSPEYSASLYSDLSFSWLNSIIRAGYTRVLVFADLWRLPNDMIAYTAWTSYRRDARPGRSLFANLLVNLRRIALSQLLLSGFRHAIRFGGIFFMNRILEYIQSPGERPRAVAYFYLCAMFISQMVASVCCNKALFLGRHMAFRINGILAGEVARKALTRKHSNLLPASEAPDLVSTLTPEDPSVITPAEGESPTVDSEDTEVSSNGKMLNLISTDLRRIVEAASYIVDVVCTPIELCVGVYVLFQLLGLSAVVGIAVMILSYPANQAIFGLAMRLENDLNTVSDRRVAAINEFLNGVRVIKLFGWENNFLAKIGGVRSEQQAVLKRYMYAWTGVAFGTFVIPILMFAGTFGAYTLVFRHTLTASIAFTSLAVYQIIQDAFFSFLGYAQYIIASKVSFDRMSNFLEQEDVVPLAEWTRPPTSATESDEVPYTLGFHQATFAWDSSVAASPSGSPAGPTAKSRPTLSINSSDDSLCSTSAPVPATDPENQAVTSDTFRLRDLDLKFPSGRLTLITGPTGSGKTSLLMALLGEMSLTAGKVTIPTERGHLTDIAYVPQEAWLRNTSIRDNIIFNAPYDEARYRQVLEACALVPDLRILKGGDLTEVGEKGITLSGGQKQRISLARAVYSTHSHLLLDDCLSAVDSHTAQYICDHCLKGPLLHGRTVLLVTHHVKLCLDVAHHLVVMDQEHGVVAAGDPTDLLHDGFVSGILLATEVESILRTRSVLSIPKLIDASEPGSPGSPGPDSLTPSIPLKVQRHSAQDLVLGDITAGPGAGQLVEEEESEEGNVSAAIYRIYLRAAGSPALWTFLLVLLVLNQSMLVFQDYWIRIWVASLKQNQPADAAGAPFAPLFVNQADWATGGGLLANSSVPQPWTDPRAPHYALRDSTLVDGALTAMQGLAALLGWTAPSTVALSRLTSAQEYTTAPSAEFFLAIYVALGGLACLLRLLQNFLVYVKCSYEASCSIHDRLLQAMMRARPQFFESTPLGRIINRFSGDMRVIDETAMNAIIMFLMDGMICLSTVVVISMVTPPFVVVAVGIGIVNLYIGSYFVATCRELKRIENIRLAPVLSLFGELIHGITSVRAYGVQARYIANALQKMDDFNRPFYLIWAGNRWLHFRTELVGALVSFFAGLLILWQINHMDAGIAGFCLSTSLAFSIHMYWLIREYGDMEMSMNSMERIDQYCQVEKEAPAVILDHRAPPGWPTQGQVELRDLLIEYKPGEPVVQQLTATIQPGEKIGLVGRTGAGKSTLALALLRFVEPTSGTIEIDGVDISQLGLDDLRHRVTMIPQDPILFQGTVRSNLDPFGEYPDQVLWDALRSTRLVVRDSEGEAEIPVPTVAPDASAHLALPPLDSRGRSASQLTAGKRTPSSSRASSTFEHLESPIAEGGKNLSLGQRQLVAMARALVRQSKVIIMDEATASVDFETDQRIQQTIRDEFASATLICIAHRLRTVIDYSRTMVLDHGQLVEFDTPLNLLERPDSLFRSMCVKSGEFDLLLALARYHHEKQQQVEQSTAPSISS
ncbi:hypothetical protein H4R33_000243 [Dimargaris cristalligena]|nr:hypothetical protein H4R33_000243 [Dimargaris cristalligena]